MIARLLISPSSEMRMEEIKKILTHAGITLNHPDLLYFPFTSKLGVAEAKKIKEFFSIKPYSAKGRAVILENGADLTDEAQNALLKTLEELPEHSLFILGANSDAKFLPTVISRCQIIQLKSVGQLVSESEILTNRYTDIQKLLTSTIEERFEYIEKTKDKEELLQNLINYFHNQLTKNPTAVGKNVKDFLKELLQAEKWQKQNVNIRAILEYLVLVMPKNL